MAREVKIGELEDDRALSPDWAFGFLRLDK